ncbi:Phage integrase [Plesiocystis pacifica SIR-1]|uniref:Phage integrase n=1 Tax=Plesiocystis pacifica SIR-1 TaxID=391625 RepID=A6GH66_9BACT|nr:site-specific integrase [Plesiocystis pacifica]EDM74788.1 Phage integrase [Plesiocystis pacifica SIR-1]
MSVKIRPYRNGGYEVDIMIRLPNGKTHRERRKSPFSAKSASLRWGRERERHLLIHGLATASEDAGPTKKEVPTLAEFAPRYMEGYAKANGHKPSTLETKRQVLRLHLIPAFGDKRLDQINSELVQRLKAKLTEHMANKSINNVLGVLNTMLKCAVEWGVLEELPVRAKRMRVKNPSMDFYDFDEYAALVKAAAAQSPECLVFVLLGGDAGLRAGEIRGLHWAAVDLRRRQLTVEHSEYKGELTTPKYDKIRTVPLTRRLADALGALPRDCELVLYRGSEGREIPTSRQTGRTMLEKAQDAAKLRRRGPHTLRHTFCSHLAMRGAAARVIQQLAGHASLVTTQRYMHLSPGATEAAIALLEQPAPILKPAESTAGPRLGEIRETEGRQPPHAP